MVAIDGTRLAGNASRESTRDFEEIAREILAEAKATDEAEDELYGDERGDELPEQLRTREGRAEFFRQAREQRAREASNIRSLTRRNRSPSRMRKMSSSSTRSGSWRASQGREGWTREAHRQLERAVGRTRIMFPARVRIGCCSPASASRPSATPRSRPTGRMRITGRTVGTRKAAGSVADRKSGSRRRCLRGW